MQEVTAQAEEQKIRAYADNVIVRLEALPDRSEGGLHLPQNRQERRTGTRKAHVLAVGPGHRDARGVLIPTEVRPGDVVYIDALAGQDYSLDLNVPRHNKPSGWADERGEFRIIREQEIHAVEVS